MLFAFIHCYQIVQILLWLLVLCHRPLFDNHVRAVGSQIGAVCRLAHCQSVIGLFEVLTLLPLFTFHVNCGAIRSAIRSEWSRADAPQKGYFTIRITWTWSPEHKVYQQNGSRSAAVYILREEGHNMVRYLDVMANLHPFSGLNWPYVVWTIWQCEIFLSPHMKSGSAGETPSSR